MTKEESLLANGQNTILALELELNRLKYCTNRLLELAGQRITLHDLFEAGFSIELDPLGDDE